MIKSKFKNKKTTVGDVVLDSKAEAQRYAHLLNLQSWGDISNLKTQVRFELIPQTKKPSGGHERKCEYVADFVYTDKNGKQIVEDVKGVKTKDYIIKRKLMLQVHGIEVKEFSKSNKSVGTEFLSFLEKSNARKR